MFPTPVHALAQASALAPSAKVVWSRLTENACPYGSSVIAGGASGPIWRVEIVWPNGAVHYVEKFTSEKDAVSWINAHPRLTKPVAENANR
jgi:hypothetical protein